VAYSYTKPVVYAPRSDAYYLSRRNFTDGTSSLGNAFSTRWSEWKKERPNKKVEVINGNAKITEVTTLPQRLEFSVDANSENRIRVNTLYYPGWEVLVNGVPATVDYQEEGTITFTTSAGTLKILVHFTETPLRKFADVVSLLGLSWLLLSAILTFNAHRNRHHSANKRA
jgi:uncharacterized membrane protein YfhO